MKTIDDWTSNLTLTIRYDKEKIPKGYRICQSMIAVNEHFAKLPISMPIQRDSVDEISSWLWKAVIDLKFAFWHMMLSEDQRRYFGFVTPFGSFRWKRAAFGFLNAPANQQYFLNNKVNAPLTIKWTLEKRRRFIMGFVDDILVGALTKDDLLSAMKEVLQLLIDLHCTVVPSSISYGNSIVALGKLISVEGVKIADRHKKVIESLKVPTTPKEMRSLFAFLSYFRGHIVHFSARTRTIRLFMVGKSSNVKRCEAELEDLKIAVKQAVPIRRPPPGSSLVLETDFSRSGLGAVLLWEQNSALVPCRLMSRRVTDGESKLSPLEGEALGIKWGLEELRADILGAHKVICLTDHQPLERLISTDVSHLNISDNLKLKISHIQSHGVTVKYRPGIKNVLADALSRNPYDETTTC